MAAFDPDAYLAQEAFNPDAYLGTPPPAPASQQPQVDFRQIPTGPGVNLTPSVPQERSFADQYIRAPIETGLALATGSVGSVIGQGAGIVQGIFGGRYGTAEGARQAQQTASDVSQQFTRTPRGEAGQEMLGQVGQFLEPLAGVPIPLMESASRAVAPLVRNPTTTLRAGVAPVQEARAASQAQRALTASELDYQNAARIDTVKAARELPEPISFNPSQSNPTMRTKTTTTLTGQNAVDKAVMTANKNKWANNAKVDLGVYKDVRLTPEVYKAIRDKAAAPYREIEKLGVLAPTENVMSSIRNMEIPDLISDPRAGAAVQGLIERTLLKVDEGMNGKQALQHVKQLRNEANNTLSAESKGTEISPSARAQADAKKMLANAIEDLIEQNTPADNPQLLADFRKARTEIKKSYDYESATDPSTGLVDPSKLPENMTGIGGTMRQVAANFPDTSRVHPTTGNTLVARVSRSGAAGTIGAGLGSLTGFGIIPGGIAGAAIGEVMGSRSARRMATPEYQAQRAVPADRRIPYVEPTAAPVVPQGQLGSGGYVPETPFKEAGPNWQFAQQQGQAPAPSARMFPELPAPSGEATRQMVMNEQNRQGAMSRTLGQQQEAAQAAQEAAAGYGQRRAYQAPEATTGAALPVEQSITTAAQKVASGQLFNMSAAEKVAWNKTKTDIQEISPALKALDSKAIAEKMADRKWVQETINKAQEKIKAFAEIEARASTMQTAREAQISREKMMDVVQQLQDTLQARPSRRSGQGPVTRQFQQENPTNRLDISFGMTPEEMRGNR